ncbi:hypothetical protein FCM35_KLT16303 [Carex littledalei]|uniref:Uncharacterized protein n=1 Tax=Carex littledalei TaxID=544730 RepID=A0A833VGD0_9POAL|nr:hypothetical protein FCM35_KLT16303 [Carex littledalei]
MVCVIGVVIFNCGHKPKKPPPQPASKVTYYGSAGGNSNYPSKSKAGVGKKGGAGLGLAAGAGVGLDAGLAVSNIGGGGYGSGGSGGASGCGGCGSG